jgi:transglutaminase-like putative cysteine protease
MYFRRLCLHSAFALTIASAALLAPLSPARAEPPKTQKAGGQKITGQQTGIDPELKAAIETAPTPALYPNANYARLLDLGNVTVKSDGTVVARFRMTYKLFNERARDLAEVNLPYNSSFQELHVVSARTIKKDGTIINVKPSDIRTTAQAGDYLMYDDAQGYGFSMPGIEEGCIIDYTWDEITHPMLMPGQFFTYWGFNGVEPVGVSRYVLHTPADKPLKFKTYNDDSLKPVVTTSLDGKTRTYTWEVKNAKPLELEPSMPNYRDIHTWMEVSSLDSWQDVAKWFWGLQSPQAKPTEAIKKTVSTLIAGKQTDEEKARAIYDWVANRTRYVGLEFGISAFKPHAASEVHDKLYGDCKDKATLLVTMLELAGIKASPVLLHADEHRAIDEGLPTLNAFNHCIALAHVAGKEVWLDATAETCAYGDIPNSDRGSRVLVVNDGKGEFKTIPPYTAADNGMTVHTDITVRPDGSAETKVDFTMRGEAGQGMRYRAKAYTPDQRRQMMNAMAQRLSTGAVMKAFDLPDGSDKNGPYVMKLAASAPSFAKKTSSLLLMPVGLGSGGERSNPYTQEERFWPIVEESASQTESVTVYHLPDGYTLEDVPADVDLVGPLQEYHRKTVKSADGTTLTVTTTVLERPGKVPPADYKKVKTYYDEMLKTTDDQIVLRKK